MVGQIDEKEEIKRTLKAYIMKDREKQRLEDEAEAEKNRKKREEDEKKNKEESEFKATKEKLVEITKKHERFQQDKLKVFEHLKKLLNEPNKQILGVDDLTRLYEIGLAVTCVSTLPSYQPVHVTNSAPSTVTPRPSSAVSHQKRNRSPSPTVYRSTYNYKQAAGPHAFQKLEDSHRNHEYRSYLFKSGNSAPPGTYSAFYSPNPNSVYTMPSSSVLSNAPVYSAYGNGRDNLEVLNKSQQQTASVIPPPPPSPSPHSSLYASHRSAIPSSASSSAPPNHVSYLVDHSKNNQTYCEDKYYMVRPATHVPVHGGVIPIQQSAQGSKHGSITSGYPIRPVATQIASQSQLHLQQHNTGHHSSQSSHHSSGQTHHAALSSHHLSSQQPQSLVQQNVGHQTHHSSSSLHYQQSQAQAQLHHTQSHQVTQPSQQPTVSISLSQQTHHPNSSQQQHIQQLHLQAHHPPSQPSPSSHHQLIQHHSSSSIHHTSSQQQIQQIQQQQQQQHQHHHHHHHTLHPHQQQQQQQQHHQSHTQALHHAQISQPHVSQHISPLQQQPSQSQSASTITSQAYSNQVSAIQGGNRVVYSQSSVSH